MSTAADKQQVSQWSEIGLVAFVFSVLMCMVLPVRPWMIMPSALIAGLRSTPGGG